MCGPKKPKRPVEKFEPNVRDASDLITSRIRARSRARTPLGLDPSTNPNQAPALGGRTKTLLGQ